MSYYFLFEFGLRPATGRSASCRGNEQHCVIFVSFFGGSSLINKYCGPQAAGLRWRNAREAWAESDRRELGAHASLAFLHRRPAACGPQYLFIKEDPAKKETKITLEKLGFALFFGFIIFLQRLARLPKRPRHHREISTPANSFP